MNKNPHISVVICTKNRAALLSECLLSIVNNTVNPDELIIVDNQSTDETPRVITSFASRVRYPVRRVTESKTGFPAIYNRGLREAKRPWVVFIDDDCIASRNWLSAMRKNMLTHPRAAAILGNTHTKFSNNIYSLTTAYFHYYWKLGAIDGFKVRNLEILDNKNIAYNGHFLKKHHIKFDETRSNLLAGAAEDCDLGKQIESAGGRALFEKRAAVFHADPTTLFSFLKKTIRSYEAYESFATKWKNEPTVTQTIRRPSNRVAIRDFSRAHTLMPWQSVALWGTIYGTYFIKAAYLFTRRFHEETHG